MKNRGFLVLAATSVLLFSCGNGGGENSSSRQELSSEEVISSVEIASSEIISSDQISSSEEEIVSVESNESVEETSEILVESSNEAYDETSQEQDSQNIESSNEIISSGKLNESSEELVVPSEESVVSNEEPLSIESSEDLIEDSLEEVSSEVVEESNEEIIESSEEGFPSEEVTSIEERVKIFSLTAEDIPETSQSQYNLDFDFESNGYAFHGDRVQRGHGEYDGTIQFSSASRGAGYFFNSESLKGTVTFNVQKKESTYGNFTGIPTIYGGSEVNPLENILPTMVSEGSNLTTYEFEFEGYFTIYNNSQYMMAVTEFIFDLE